MANLLRQWHAYRSWRLTTLIPLIEAADTNTSANLLGRLITARDHIIQTRDTFINLPHHGLFHQTVGVPVAVAELNNDLEGTSTVIQNLNERIIAARTAVYTPLNNRINQIPDDLLFEILETSDLL